MDRFKILPVEFLVTVDYNQSLIQMIQAARFDYMSKDINFENSLIKSRPIKKVIPIGLVNFGKRLESKEIFEKLKKRNLRSVNLEELLIFSADYPQEQLDKSIVALGSPAQRENIRLGVCILGLAGSRLLVSVCLDKSWHKDLWFAVVQK